MRGGQFPALTLYLHRVKLLDPGIFSFSSGDQIFHEIDINFIPNFKLGDSQHPFFPPIFANFPMKFLYIGELFENMVMVDTNIYFKSCLVERCVDG